MKGLLPPFMRYCGVCKRNRKWCKCAAIDVKHLTRQIRWSLATFGPGDRHKGVIDHIRKELLEIEEDPTDLKEWVDVIILALDGAWRSGAKPQDIIDAIKVKQAKNEQRVWPDWRTMPTDKAIEHDRSADLPKKCAHAVYSFRDNAPICSDCGAICWETYRSLL